LLSEYSYLLEGWQSADKTKMHLKAVTKCTYGASLDMTAELNTQLIFHYHDKAAEEVHCTRALILHMDLF